MRFECRFIGIEALLCLANEKKKEENPVGSHTFTFRHEHRQYRVTVGDRNFGRAKCQPISHLRQAVSYYRVEV